MRRAIIATVGTVVGLTALLSYKSSGAVRLPKVALGTGQNAPGTVVTPHATSTPTTAGNPGPATTQPPPTTASAQRTYTGQDVQYIYGDIQVAVSMQGSRIVNVAVPQNGAIDGRSQMINSYAVPILEQEAVAAQGLNFNVVSGATFTSDAFAQSLQSALSQAGK